MYRKTFFTTQVILFGSLFLLFGCNRNQDLLKSLIKTNQSKLGMPAKHPDQFKVQIIYTQIDRDSLNEPSFKSFPFRLDESIYFYPASTVKMPTAISALEKLNTIPKIDEHTSIIIDSVRHPQTPVYPDSTNFSPNIKEYVDRIFLVSDNNAFNRLYEFLGQYDLNHNLYLKGFRHTRIIHRLSRPEFNYEDNRYTNPVFFTQHKDTIYGQPEIYSSYQYPHPELSHQICGKGFIDSEGNLVKQPFNFSYKNFISLKNLHDILKAVIFPNQHDSTFHLTPSQYSMIYTGMSQLPRQSDFVEYHDSLYTDNYVKYFMYGDKPQSRIPDHIKIYNKIGAAYGTLTDVAYIIDTLNHIEFLLAATVHINKNEIFNDGVYEYEEIGLPFLGELGRLIYQYDLNRFRKYPPDFNEFLRAH